jgi:hypothetical protein
MMTRLPLAAAVFSMLSVPLLAQKNETPQARFVPLRPLSKLPGTIIPPHSHPVDEHITVLEGTFFFGVSDQFDLSLLKELKAGSYAFAPKGSTMFGSSPDGAIVQAHGVGPFHIHWRGGSKSPGAGESARAMHPGHTSSTRSS